MANRFIDPKNGQLLYMCENGVECSRIVVDRITANKTEPIQAFKINKITTGNLYGFNAPKNGTIIFKTNEPPAVNEKVSRGLECANVSTMTGHINNLVFVGTVLKRNGKTDFDLNNTALLRQREIKNSTRACTLLDLILRLMDQLGIENKRWFFNDVQAFYGGHVGLFRSAKKQKVKAKAK
jgi:hypothetical protein